MFRLSGGSATIYAYLGEFHCNKMRNRAIMSSAFISALAAILFPLSAWVAINQTWSFNVPFLDIIYRPWRMYILLVGTFGLVCGVCLFYFPESPKYLLSAGSEEEALIVLKRVYSINTGNTMDSYKVRVIDFVLCIGLQRMFFSVKLP